MKSTTLIPAWKTASRKKVLFYNEGGETLEQAARKLVDAHTWKHSQLGWV